jgi:hypothetical protein
LLDAVAGAAGAGKTLQREHSHPEKINLDLPWLKTGKTDAY